MSFLAAAMLYYFAAGDVKGFAFTLGLSTVLDLVVVFLFTHPLVSLFSRSAAFGSARFTGLNHVRAGGVATRSRPAPGPADRRRRRPRRWPSDGAAAEPVRRGRARPPGAAGPADAAGSVGPADRAAADPRRRPAPATAPVPPPPNAPRPAAACSATRTPTQKDNG